MLCTKYIGIFINFTEQYFVSFYLIIKLISKVSQTATFKLLSWYFPSSSSTSYIKARKKETFKLPKKFVVNKRKLDFSFVAFPFFLQTTGK